MDEKEWIKRIVAGDTQMFSCLVAKYERMAYTIAFRILGNKEEAEEATQDAFVRMYRALPRFQFESKFSTWFYRIVYRVAISAARQLRLFEEVPVETAEAVTPGTGTLGPLPGEAKCLLWGLGLCWLGIGFSCIRDKRKGNH